MPEPDRPSHSHHSCPHCQVKTSSPAAADLEKSESPSHHPSQFLSKQSRRAFLTSLGAATALGTNMIGFRRDPQAAKAQTLQSADSIRDAGNIHTLKATPETCFWGFFDKDLPPVLTIDSGDIVYVEALTHHAGDAPDLLMDEGIREVYKKVTNRGPGVHIMTGPIAIRGAEVGDTLMVRVLVATHNTKRSRPQSSLF